MASLLDPLTDAQEQLIGVVGDVFLRYRRWPIFDYVEKMLARVPLDATRVLTSFPTSDRLFGGPPYSAIWAQGGANDRPVELTVLGLHHCERLHRDPRYPPLEETFFLILNFLIDVYRAVEPSPFEIQTVEADGDEIALFLKRQKHDWLPLDALFELLKHEPATWYGRTIQRPGESTSWVVTRHVLDYDGVAEVAGYVERMAALSPPPPAPPPVPLPAAALPAALDFLDAVWRLVPGHDKSLLRLVSAERTAKLGQEIATEETLAGALSALSEILTSVQIPKAAAAPQRARRRTDGDPTLERLRGHLLNKVPEGGQTRVNNAIDVLQSIVDLRHGSHHGHSDARSRAAAAYERLRIGFPPSNPALAWETIRSETVAAITDIREELAPLSRPSQES